MIHEAGEAIIGGLRLAGFLFVEVAVVVKKSRDILEFAVVGGISVFIAHRQVDFVRVIHLVERFGAGQRIVRADQGYKSCPRRLGPGFVCKPVFSGGGDVEIIVGIAALADADICSQFGCGVIRRQVFPQKPDRPTDSADHMHRQYLLREAVVILARAEMQLADRNGVDTAVTQLAHPTARRSVIGRGAVPIARFVNVVPCRNCSPRWHAHGRGSVGIAKERPTRRQCVQVRCLYNRVPRTSHRVFAMLIRNDDQYVGRGSHVWRDCAAG